MKEIVTAKKVYYKVTGCILESHHTPDIERAMVEFAAIHVEAALKAKIEAMREYHEDGGYSLSEMDAFTRNSYPLSNIK